jgi:hypothetical protein
MPHVPLQQPFGLQPPDTKAPAPTTKEPGGGTAVRKKLGLDKLSLKNFTVDPLTVYQKLTGRPPLIDEMTRQIVYQPTPSIQPPI